MPEQSGRQGQVWSTALHVWKTGAQELTRLERTIDPGALEACVDAIAKCTGRIVTAGVGTSGAAAKKVAHSLSCVERPSFFLDPGDAVHGALGAVQSDDVAILFSKGGGTREIVNVLPALQTKRAFIIGVTENPDSEREADEFNMLATTSTMAVIAVFDAVAIALMKRRGYTKEQFAVIHPGGAVGEQLLQQHKEQQ